MVIFPPFGRVRIAAFKIRSLCVFYLFVCFVHALQRSRTSQLLLAVVTLGTNITTTSQNGSSPSVPVPVPSKTTVVTTATNITTTAAKSTITTVNITSTTAKSTTAKSSTTKAPPDSPKSPNVTTVTPKAPSSGNTTAVAATAKAAANLSRASGFDVGSFIGGIVLTLGLLVIGYIGCRTYHSKRGVQYRTIDEHDAII